MRAIADERLLLNVRIEHAVSDDTYGAPRIQRELAEQGIHVGTKRVARLMREDGLAARQPTRGVRTTDSTHAHPIAPNLLNRQFDVHGVRMNRVWVSDTQGCVAVINLASTESGQVHGAVRKFAHSEYCS